jgi:hypothetical protein
MVYILSPLFTIVHEKVTTCQVDGQYMLRGQPDINKSYTPIIFIYVLAILSAKQLQGQISSTLHHIAEHQARREQGNV